MKTGDLAFLHKFFSCALKMFIFILEGDFRIYVTTGNSGTKEVVTITAYGDKSRSANITLGKKLLIPTEVPRMGLIYRNFVGKGHEKGVFQCGQTDEFEANFAEIGRLYKIRIGVEEASPNCDWRLKQVYFNSFIFLHKSGFKPVLQLHDEPYC